MSDFKNQINEDIKEIQEEHPNIPHIIEAEYAFNFWVLDKLYKMDESIIPDNITEYNDRGIDCYFWDDENKDLFLIQNKYFSETTPLTKTYVENTFLEVYRALKKGTYTRSEKLQKIYNDNASDSSFSFHLKLYVTRSIPANNEVFTSIAKFNNENKENRIDAEILDIDEIEKAYYNEDNKWNPSEQHFIYPFTTKNKGTILNVNKEYGLETKVDAKYCLISTYEIYELIERANKKGYPIFDRNIREFLGTSGLVNKKIQNTLNNSDDRKNFFFYNNGITIILKEFKMGEGTPLKITITDPQIVNGCQTVSTIHSVISKYRKEEREKEFAIEKSSVMVKFIKTTDEEIYGNIVRYNKSQNGIKDKDFTASSGTFKRIQEELEDKGLLLLVKQSDKNTYKTKYNRIDKLLDKSGDDFKLFGLNPRNYKDVSLDLEKLLQAILAFDDQPVNAVQNKSKLLIPDTPQYSKTINFIRTHTKNDLYYLAMLFMSLEKNKFNTDSEEGANPFYIIYFLNKYECKDGGIKDFFDDCNQEKIKKFIDKYTKVFKFYYSDWKEKYKGKSYLDMIKSGIDFDVLEKAIRYASF